MRQRFVCARAMEGRGERCGAELRRRDSVRRGELGHGRRLLPPGVKMMHRAVAVADGEFVGGRDRGGDVGFRVADRVARASRPCARPAAIAEESVQPVPCVLLVSIFSAVKRAIASRVTSRSVASGACAWPPLISTALAPSASSACACARISSSFCASGVSVSAAASCRFGVMSSARGKRSRLSACDRFRREQPVAGGCDHHGVEHDVGLFPAVEPGRDRADRKRHREHADLHGVRQRGRRTPHRSAPRSSRAARRGCR